MDYSCMRTHVSAQLGRTHGATLRGRWPKTSAVPPCQPLDWSQAPVFVGATSESMAMVQRELRVRTVRLARTALAAGWLPVDS